MEKPFLEESFLITEKDYVNMSAEKNKYLIPKENRIILRILGILAICCGTAAFINIRNGIYQTVCWVLLIIIGLYVLCYYDIINISMIRKQSAAFYNIYKKSIHSKSVRLYSDKFEIKSEERRLVIPKKYIYKTVEGKNTIIIFIDKNEFCFLPKRIFSEAQLENFRSFYKEKYILP